nr:DUF2115 domain-containing protein [Methanothermus fervidus]
MSKRKLLHILKKASRKVSVNDLMNASVFLNEEIKYMHKQEKKEYIRRFMHAFFMRLNELKNDKKRYEGSVDIKKLKELVDFMENKIKNSKSEKERSFYKIAAIVSIYATFVKEVPIHPLSTKFPGNLKIRYRKGKYLCPVKDKQKESPEALCKFCVAVQDESVL